MNRLLPHGLRVLVVEDEAILAAELCAQLQRLDVVPLGPVDTADAAVRVATSERPDIVLLDIRLKGGADGVEAGQLLRLLDIPFIFLTAHADPATMHRAILSAPYGYLLKPFHEGDLVAAVATAIGRATQEQIIKDVDSMYAATLACIGEGVIATDLEGSVLFVNEAAEALARVPRSGARGRPIAEVLRLVDEDTGDVAGTGVEQALAGVASSRAPKTMLAWTLPGAMVPVEVRAAPVVTGRGRLYGAVVTLRDLRSQRAAAAELQAARDALHEAARLESIGRLAGGIAHDFSNLVMMIGGACAEIERSRLDADTRARLLDIEAAADRAAALTQQLLAFGKKQVVAPRALDLNQVVRGFERLLVRALGSGVRLGLELSEVATCTHADPIQLEQILMNLALNARDAMPSGGQLVVRTELASVEQPRTARVGTLRVGAYVVLRVGDTGPGMSEQVMAHLFDPFFTTKSAGRGIGLGLATVACIVEQLGGAVDVESSEGDGTSFTIWLPGATVARASESPAPPSRRTDKTVLVVEDEEILRNMFARVLRAGGFLVIEAASGEAALQILGDHGAPIDVLLTDVVMDDVSGRQVADAFASRHPEGAIIVMSGFTDDVMLKYGIEKGKYAFLRKPFRADSLLATVHQVASGTPRAVAG